MQVFSTTIEKLAFGGSGVCRVNGKVCFVPYSAPGDELKISITSDKRSYQIGRIQEIVSESTQRTTPVCQLFGTCGGCSWQHLSYAAQLQAKQQILAECMFRGARVPIDRITSTVCSPQAFSYRSRVQFKVHYSNNNLRIGFFRSATHVVEDIGMGCPIAAPVINEVIGRFRKVLSGTAFVRAISEVHVDCADNGVIAVVYCAGRNSRGLAGFFSKLEQDLLLDGLYLQIDKKQSLIKVFGGNELTYLVPSNIKGGSDTSLSYKAGGFSQVNREQNINLLQVVRRLADFSGNEDVLDLYCGNGNFTLPLAGQVAQIIGVEEHSGSISSAKANCRNNNISNAHFICADAAAGARSLADEGRNFHTVILDPPRSGASEAVRDICRLKPYSIVYISCDPSTLARDCGLFSEQGYEVVESVPVDMFPQTYHIESVTLLRTK